MVNLAPTLWQRFSDSDNAPLVGGKLYSYIAGTSIPLATFTDASGDTPNTNPIILDSTGSADVWLETGNYKFILEDADGDVLRTIDNVAVAGTGPAGASFLTGAGAPSIGIGQNGDSYLDTTTGNIWYKSSGTWAVISSAWTKYAVTDGQSATSLTGQTVDGTVYTSAKYEYEIIRGTTVIDNGAFFLQYANGTWRVSNASDSGDLSGVTFSITQSTTIAQLKAALNVGAGNGTIKVSRTLIPV